MSKNNTFVLQPSFQCAKECEEFFDNKLKWGPNNNDQLDFINLFSEKGKNNLEILKEYIKGKSSRDVEVINNFLKEEGFDIRLQGGYGPLSFYVAGVFKYALEWLRHGSKVVLEQNNDSYKAVMIPSRNVSYEYSSSHQHPFAILKTKNQKEKVYMTMIDSFPDTWQKALEWISWQKQSLKKGYGGYFVFPQIDYNELGNTDWIVGLQMFPQNDDLALFYEVVEAVYQTKFKMDEKGAKVEAAAGWGMSGCSGATLTPYEINKPFLVWIEREDSEIPIFIGHFGQEDWVKTDDSDNNLDKIKGKDRSIQTYTNYESCIYNPYEK